MLQTEKSSSVADMPVSLAEEAGLADMASFMIGIVRRQYLIILFITVFATSVGATYLWITPPTYVAKAQILIDRSKSAFLQQQAVFPDTPIDVAQVESQIQILASQRVAASVVKSLHLTEDPEFVGGAGGLVNSLGGTLADALRGLGLNVFRPHERPRSDSDLVHQVAGLLLRNLQVSRAGFAFIIEVNYRS